MILGSVLAMCITLVVLSERFYRFKKSMLPKPVHPSEAELAEIKEEISKLKSRMNGEKLEKALRR